MLCGMKNVRRLDTYIYRKFRKKAVYLDAKDILICYTKINVLCHRKKALLFIFLQVSTTDIKEMLFINVADTSPIIRCR